MSDPNDCPSGRHLEKVWNTFVRARLPWVNAFPEEYWEARKLGESHGPHQYMEPQESSHILIEEVVRNAHDQRASILDLGCNVGRHLNALYQRGFTNLYGVDVQKAAVEKMGQVFPEMAEKVRVEQASFQEYLPKVPDRFFDLVFTHGATIELVPPSFPICWQMARVAGKTLVLVINESDHSFPRYWTLEFRLAGFRCIKSQRPIHKESRASLLVFQRNTA